MNLTAPVPRHLATLPHGETEALHEAPGRPGVTCHDCGCPLTPADLERRLCPCCAAPVSPENPS